MTLRRAAFVVCFFICLCLCFSTHAYAQSSNANITGVVTDSSGASIAGAELTLEATDSAKVSKAMSGEDGLFSFPNLQQGNYQLKVSAKGFKDFLQTGIALHLNDS